MEDSNLNNDLSKSELFYGSNLNIENSNLTANSNKLAFSNIEPVLKKEEEEEEFHYLCPKCHKFPFVEFTKSKKTVNFTCSCYTSQEISIKELFEQSKNYITKVNLLSSTIDAKGGGVNDNYEGLVCNNNHKNSKKFKYYCKTCSIHFCEYSLNEHEGEPHKIFELVSLKIDNEKLNKIIAKVNQNYFDSNIINDMNMDLNQELPKIKLNQINDKEWEKYTEEDENTFNKFIRLIINDYKNYPNFSHFFNIQNIIHYYDLNNNNKNHYNAYDNKNKEKIENIELNEKNEIIIEYINNNSNIKLFNEEFAKKNNENAYLNIEGKIYDLNSPPKFENNDNIITIKLIINENICEIDMSEMFSGCINLISINGISKLKGIKITNQYKMFYNCTSLISIPDINDWKISKDIDIYLMFYNCISLIYFRNSVLEKLPDYYYLYNELGILITKYYQNEKEIIFKTMIDNNKRCITLYGKEFQVNNADIKIFNGNEYELLLFYKKKDENNNNNLTIYYKNEVEKNLIETKVILKVINKLSINKILTTSTDFLSKWNTVNVTDMSYMFYRSKNLSYLSDISKWNTINVTNMNGLFFGCESLSRLPDISKWNTKNVIDMSSFFYNCKSLSTLSDISKWKTNSVINMYGMFCGCESLIYLPDISKWETNNVTNMSEMFYGCKSLHSLPDISNWNISNVKYLGELFSCCESLVSLPDMSKWDTKEVKSIRNIFFNCKSLLTLSDISKWNTNNIEDMSGVFWGCESLLCLPDISKWNTNKVEFMNYMFSSCRSLSCLPDISKWDINNVQSMSHMFNNCKSLCYLPDLSKWNINYKIKSLKFFFAGCMSLSFLPDISKWDKCNSSFGNILDDCISLSYDYVPDLMITYNQSMYKKKFKI